MPLTFVCCTTCGERFDAHKASARVDSRRLCRACEEIDRLLAALPHPSADERGVTMPCPASPEPNGLHKYALAGAGTEFPGVCAYCGQPQTFRPYAGDQTMRNSSRGTVP
jgi:hypothetical protein